jgi:hypothetical protein
VGVKGGVTSVSSGAQAAVTSARMKIPARALAHKFFKYTVFLLYSVYKVTAVRDLSIQRILDSGLFLVSPLLLDFSY